MTTYVKHSKILAETQFEGMKGSTPHAIMTMNKVVIAMPPVERSKTIRTVAAISKEVTDVIENQCKNYVFIAEGIDHVRCYFLSKRDMQDFMMWTTLKYHMAKQNV